MPNRPLLIFPSPVEANRTPPNGRVIPPNYHTPDRGRQTERFDSTLQSMLAAFVTDSAIGIEPEKVLVIETIGRIEDFSRAVNAIRGLQWLAEIDVDEIEPDTDFFEVPKIKKRLLYKEVEEISTQQSSVLWEILKDNDFIDDFGVITEKDIEEFHSFIPSRNEKIITRHYLHSILKMSNFPNL